MARIVLALTVCFLFTGCCFFSNAVPCDVKECLPWRLMRFPESSCVDGVVFERIMCHVQQTAIKFKHERRLKLENSTVYYDASVQSFRLDFSTMAMLTLCEARELIVDLTEDFLKRINSDSTISRRPVDRFFTADDLEIQINFQPYMGIYRDLDYIGWVSLKGGCVHLYSFDARSNWRERWQRRSESYRESRAVVRCEREAEKEWEEDHKDHPDVINQIPLYDLG